MKARTLSDRIEREYMSKFHRIIIPVTGDIQFHTMMNDCRAYFRRIKEESAARSMYLMEGLFYTGKYITLTGITFLAGKGFSELLKYL